MCKSNLFIYFFKEKSCFNYMPETPLSVIFFQTFIIFFFSVTARSENNYNFGSIGHNSLIQTLNVLSSKKKISSKFSWFADHTLKIFLQEKFCFFMHHPEMILRCLTSYVEFWNKQLVATGNIGSENWAKIGILLLPSPIWMTYGALPPTYRRQ